MQPLLTRIQDSTAARWYFEQSQRDQRLLLLLAVFLTAVLFWLLLWLPIQDRLAIAEVRHARALTDQRWIREQRETLQQMAAGHTGAGNRTGQALLSTVATSARGAGITLNRFQPEGSDALAVSLEDVAFGELVVWLEQLQRQDGIRVRSATIDAQNAPGRVRARILLY